MATLAENIERGRSAMNAADLDATDAGTKTSDAIAHVLHAGFAQAQYEAVHGLEAPNVDEGGAKFVPGETNAETWLDDVIKHVRLHFLAEQAGEDS